MSSAESAFRFRGVESLIRVERNHVSVGIGREVTQSKPKNKLQSEITDINLATAQDIKDRMIFQEVKYVLLDRAGNLTPPWRKFGKKHRAEIEKIESILDKLE